MRPAQPLSDKKNCFLVASQRSENFVLEKNQLRIRMAGGGRRRPNYQKVLFLNTMTSRGVSMFWNVKMIKILKLLNIVKLMNIPKLVNMQKLLDVLRGSLRTIQHRKIPCNFLDKMKYHAITWFTVQYHHMLCNTIQMGHIGPKEPILGPPAGQKRPNNKYVVTMGLTQLDRLVAVRIKSGPQKYGIKEIL